MCAWGRRVLCLFCGLILLTCAGCGFTATDSALTMGSILIDPGHGGVDGGAVAQDGTMEKNINLAVGLCLRDMLLIWGFPVTVTRDTDKSIHDPVETSIHSIKVSDMHNRLALYEQAAVIISIHQNHFSAEKYFGAQVFYSPNHEESYRFGEMVRQALIIYVQPENKREMKKAGDGIFLLSHTKRPAILVECGFLSNEAERQKLKTPSYQQQLAFALTGGYMNYLVLQE